MPHGRVMGGLDRPKASLSKEGLLCVDKDQIAYTKQHRMHV